MDYLSHGLTATLFDKQFKYTTCAKIVLLIRILNRMCPPLFNLKVVINEHLECL